MKSFLSYVAQDILSKYGHDLSRLTVVFPNKRASLFLNEHLARLAGGKPIWSPAFITISELFRQYSSRQVADPVKLVCDLHKSFVAQTGIDETLDHFYGWGQLLLADFDDIDKQLADADRVLANLADIHELDDDSFLTPTQREVLQRFFSNFSDEHNSELKQRFLRLWSRMADIYHDFNQRLEAQGLAYEGALYREVVGTENGERRTENGEVRTENGELRTERYDYLKDGEPSNTQTDYIFGGEASNGKTNHTSQFSVLTSQFSPFTSQFSPLSSRLFLFVGFNALLQVEQRLFTILHQQGKARFYWDFDHYYMPQANHSLEKGKGVGFEAGHFISQYLEAFPNELDIHDADIYDCFRQPKQLRLASASTENIQARYATQWLREENRIADGRQTAIVLCNEGLLPVIIHCLPEEVQQVNITTGFPLSQSSMPALITALIALRRDGYDHSREHFRLRQVDALLRHPYLMSASPQITALRQQLKEEHNYYPTRQQLSIDPLTTLLFRSFDPIHQNEAVLSWLCEVVKAIARTPATDVLREESIFQTYTLLNRLLSLTRSGDLITDSITLGRLIGQLMQATTIPFHGEPVEGLQVMGLLETRNLDFKHLLILSAQEGNLPRGASDTSFIPYSLRRAYGLTTPDHKEAIYSYYFHRLLQRAEDVTIVYNNATTDGQKGEMSRFLLQLMATPLSIPEGGKSSSPSGRVGGVTLLSLQGYQNSTIRKPQPVENQATLPQMLTPTAINTYLRCPLRFHYRYVCRLIEPDTNDDDSIDNRIFGNIFHDAAQIIYTRLADSKGGFAAHPQILAADLDKLLKDRFDIERAVDEAFCTHLHSPLTTHHSPLKGLQLINREVIIHYLRQLISNDRQLTPFTMLSLEEEVKIPLSSLLSPLSPLFSPLSSLLSPLPATLGGRVDRLDKITLADGSEQIRVIDYKTGAHRMKALPSVEAIFQQEYLKEHSDYYLQAMLYALIVARQQPSLPVAPALLFIQHAGTESYDPVLRFGKDPISDVSRYDMPFMQQLNQVITRMFDPAQPLTPTEDRQRCNSCPYRQLCY